MAFFGGRQVPPQNGNKSSITVIAYVGCLSFDVDRCFCPTRSVLQHVGSWTDNKIYVFYPLFFILYIPFAHTIYLFSTLLSIPSSVPHVNSHVNLIRILLFTVYHFSSNTWKRCSLTTDIRIVIMVTWVNFFTCICLGFG